MTTVTKGEEKPTRVLLITSIRSLSLELRQLRKIFTPERILLPKAIGFIYFSTQL